MKNFYLTKAFLTLTVAFILIAVATTYAQTIYFVKQTGNDGLSGTSEANAWQSLIPVNNKMSSSNPFQPGDKILFERGSQFYGTIVIKCSGSDVNPIVFGAYGTGPKPIFKAAAIIDPDTYKDVLHSNWKYEYGRIWSYKDDLTGIDVANLIFTKDGNTITGRKIMNSSPSFSNHGDFWYDFVNDRILIYSEVGNPTDFYDMIQTVQSINAIEFPDDDQYIVFENLDFRYFGNCVVEQKGSNCTYKDLDISFIGGADLSGDYSRRHGHGLQMWNGVHDVTITSCTFDNIYESGVAIAGENHSKINIKNNVITNCEYSLEFWNTSTSSNTHNIFIEHNTCVNAGGGWGHNQRDDVPGQGTNFIFGKMQGSYSNISVQSNIFCGSTDRLFWIIYPEEVVGKSGFTIDNNCFYKNNNESVGTLGTENKETLALWQIATGFETKSVDVNPLFVSFSDFHLQYNSPLIGFGIKGYAGSFNPFNAYDIVLSSQADVNAFNYNEINGNLYICGFDINDLSPLVRLTHVYFPAGTGIGNLNIVHNNLLTNLDALQNLTYISEGLNIRNNAKLTNIDGLKNLNSVGVNYGMCGELFVNDLKIYNNPELERFCGLYSLFNGGQLGGVFEVHDNAQNPTKEEIIYGGPCTIYEGDLILSSQAEVDAFYFTEITGSLTISGADIENLNQLSCLTAVGGGLRIESNAKLNSLSGLDNLTSVGHTDNDYPYAPGYSLVITHNDLIANLDELQKLTSFEGGIIIQDNASLVNLNKLKNLVSIGYFVEIAHIDPKYGFITGSKVSIDISRNAKLTSIDSLQNLISVGGGIRIYDNASLKNLDGFQKLASVGYCSEFVGYADDGPSPNPVFRYISIIIINNPTLYSFCGLYTLLSKGGVLPGEIVISGNAVEITRQQIISGGPCGTTIYNGDLILSSQTEVDLFHYTEVTGRLTISGADITDLTPLLSLTSVGTVTNVVKGGVDINSNPLLTKLNGLQNLASIGGGLKIENNAALTSLSGLQNLSSVGWTLSHYFGGYSLNICNNGLLPNLNGLEKLTSVPGYIVISGNNLLINLNGLENLTHISGSSEDDPQGRWGTLRAHGLYIENNISMASLDGLQNLNYVGGDIRISDNISLFNLDGLKNLNSVVGLIISNNNELTDLNGLQNLVNIGTTLSISGNGSLISLNGLQNITSIGSASTFLMSLDLNISGNGSLVNIDGLQNLTYVGGNLIISDNDMLTNLDGLENLTTVGSNVSNRYEFVGGGLSIIDNDALLNINGLHNLTYIASGLDIRNNSVLTNLDGLKNLTSMGSNSVYWLPELHIVSNPVLTRFCGLYPFISLSFAGGYEVHDNAINPTQQEIIDGGPCLIYFGDLTLLSQTEVNAFHYTEVTGMLIISGSDITDLTPLLCLTYVGGNFRINNNNVLTNVNGLQNLKAVRYSLGIHENGSLTSLVGLQNLTSVGGGLGFYHNNALTSLDGFQNLTSVGGALEIWGNELLTNLYGLQNITSLGWYFNLTGTALTNLDELRNLTSVGGWLEFWGNTALTNLDGLENLNVLNGVDIHSNSALTRFCGIYPVLSGGGFTGGYEVHDNAVNPTKQQIIDDVPCNSIGNTQVYSNALTWNNQLAMPVAINAAGEIERIAIYHDGGTGNLLLGVYSDQGGFPSSRLGLTASTAVNPAAGWQTIQLTSPVEVISGQKVWLSWVFQNNPGIRYTEGTPGRAASSNTWAKGMPESFGPSTLAPNKYSVYCTLSTENYPPDANIPVVNEFSIPAASTSLIIPVSSFTATDNTGVRGYLLTEWATAPMADNAGWRASAPASYTFTTAGTKTLYAWAKDAAGNISESLSADVIIALPSDTKTPFGNTDLYNNTINWGNQLAMPVTFSVAGEIQSIAIYHEGGNGNVLLGVYSDQGGFPSSRLGVTVSTAVSLAAGWQTILLSSAVEVISGQKVWLSWVFQNSPRMRYTEGTPGRAASSNIWANGMPVDYGPSTLAPNKYSVYCTLSTENYPPDVINPIVTEFSFPPGSESLTVSVSSFTTTDNTGVRGYLLTESATTPLFGDAGWSASAPVSYTFTTEGNKTLFAWAKDAAGNVSSSLSADVIITLPSDSETPFGNTNLYNNTINWGNQLAMPVTFTEAGEIRSIAIYHEGGFGNVLLGVYSDKDGSPFSRLGITASTAVNPAAGWQTIQLPTPVSVNSSQTVWLSWVFENAPGIRYTAGTPGRAASSNKWANGMPVDFGPSTIAPNRYSIYCNFFLDYTKSGKIYTENKMDIMCANLKVYPNPFSDRLRFEFISPESVNARIDLYDMTGRMVKTIFKQTIEKGVNYEAEFEPNSMINGMYFYRVIMGNNITNGKVVYIKE